MFRASVLLCALLFCVPTFWQAFHEDITIDAALTRFLIAIPVAAVLLAVVRAAARPAQPSTDETEAADAHRPR